MVLPATCRICSQEHVPVGNIYIASVDGINDNQCLSQLVYWCASVQAEPNEGISKMICTICKQELIRTYKFLSLLKQTSVFLKQEVKTLDEEDDVRSGNYFNNYIPVNIDTPEHYRSDVNSDGCKKENAMPKIEFINEDGEADTLNVNAETTQNENFTNSEEKNVKIIKEEYVTANATSAGPSMHQTLQPATLYCDLGPVKHSHSELDHIFCKICGAKLYKYKYNIRKHMKTHINRSFKCDVCSKLFSTQTHLKVHMMIHTKEKPFKCHLCAKDFSQISDFNVHKMTHFKDKLMECQICSKEFKHISTFKRHMMVHDDTRLAAHNKTH